MSCDSRKATRCPITKTKKLETKDHTGCTGVWPCTTSTVPTSPGPQNCSLGGSTEDHVQPQEPGLGLGVQPPCLVGPFFLNPQGKSLGGAVEAATRTPGHADPSQPAALLPAGPLAPKLCIGPYLPPVERGTRVSSTSGPLRDLWGPGTQALPMQGSNQEA